MRQAARSVGLTAQTCLKTFVKAYPAHRLAELKKGILGSHPENRRGDIVLCVDHCKGQGEMAGGVFTLNICDVDTHELFAQEVVASDNLAELCLLLREVCSLPYIEGRVAIVYYDKVTAKTAAAIKRATGAKYVLQDPWHVANRINSACNNRVGGELYNEHVRAVSNALYVLNQDKVEDIKQKLWKRELLSCLALPGDGRKKTRFKDLTDLQIFQHLMRPPDYDENNTALPVIPSDPSGMRRALRDFELLPKFYETFKAVLMKDLRAKEDMKQKLEDVYWFFRNKSVNGRDIYPHKGRMYKRFQNAKKRCDFMEDPVDVPVYRVVGTNARGLDKLQVLRGTEVVESYHSQGKEIVHSDKLGRTATDAALMLGNLRWNTRRRVALPPKHPLKEADMGHTFWWKTSGAVLMAREAEKLTGGPASVSDGLARKSVPKDVSLGSLGMRTWTVPDQEVVEGQRRRLLRIQQSDTTDAMLVSLDMPMICRAHVRCR